MIRTTFAILALILASLSTGSGKPHPETAKELGEFLAGTTWNIRDGRPDGAIQYTITFNADGTFMHSDGRKGRVTFTGARTLKLWKYDPATLNEDFSQFRAKGTATVYFGSLIRQVPAQPPPPIVGSLVDPVALRGVEDVHLEGAYAYLPCREGKRLTICSIKDPTKPKVVSSFTHTELGHAAGLAIDGDTIYLTSQGTSKLLVIDASDKSALRLAGSVLIGPPGKGLLYKVAYRNGLCYVAHYSDKKLFVVDVRDPRKPVVVSSVAVATEDDGPFSVLLRGDYALVGTIFGSRDRLVVVDISDPTDPHLVTQVRDPDVGHASGEVVGDLFFAVHWNKNAFLVFDLADPGNPKLVAKLVDKRLGKPNRCSVSGNYAYLPMVEGDGVAVVDIADPMAPKFLTSFRNPLLNKAYGLAVRDDFVFAGAREGNSLVVLDRRTLNQHRE